MVAVVMPRLGESVVEGTLLKWLVREGERVARDQLLCQVETDKATSEVPSPQAGTIVKLLVPEGQTVQVGAALCELEPGAEVAVKAPMTAASAPAPAAPPSPVAPPTPAAPPLTVAPRAPVVPQAPALAPRAPVVPATIPPAPAGPGAEFASPAVRRLVREQGVDLRAIQGSGRHGRVTRDDVVDYLRLREQPARGAHGTTALALVPAPAEIAPVAAPPAPALPAVAVAASGAPATGLVPFQPTAYRPPRVEPREGDEVIPFTRRRRIIAEHMVYSKITSPHVATVAEVDMHKVSLARTTPRPNGVKPSFLAYICAATVRALRAHQRINSSVGRDALIVHHAIHLGVAVDTDEGLVVPVVKNADRHTVEGLHAAVEELAAKARSGKLTADDLSGGTFTISNPGREGNLFGVSIINQPQVAILRMGELIKRPVVVTTGGEDHIVVHPMMHLCLSYDHRVIDGVAANRFLYEIRGRLERVEV